MRRTWEKRKKRRGARKGRLLWKTSMKNKPVARFLSEVPNQSIFHSSGFCVVMTREVVTCESPASTLLGKIPSKMEKVYTQSVDAVFMNLKKHDIGKP
ncbi:hypothetical protein BT96DRAFT_1072353 [Gymnopus androsaceus JB14]|uniref:Uncharacterized protein n=1 Tax=Gymnopus androsaceus JB14 TaxID=1447944 RepID=A0A6A4GT67_9AGAR|nr:hypothetical protein BT96DRAFT_1072353 [Gymnopus androsaceus JB14]